MFSFLFKFIVLPILLVAGIAAGTAAWLLLTPISEDSVKSRIWQACMVGAAVQRLNQSARRVAGGPFSSAQCTCAAETVIASMGVPLAAKGAEAVRAFMEAGLRQWYSGGSYRPLQSSQTGRMAEGFVMQATRISQPCLNQPQ